MTIEKGFLPVRQIKLGMHVLEADGQVGVISGWKVVLGVKTMYNLEVAQDHTFVVGVGMWVVHNCSDPMTGQTTKDLYRGGNSTSPRLDNLRGPTPEGNLRELDANGNISPGMGPSTFESPRGSKNWWHLPSGSNIPEEVQIINDHGDHWVVSPTKTMKGSEFVPILSQMDGWEPMP